MVALLLVRPQQAANFLSLLCDFSEFARRDRFARYTVLAVGPTDCVNASAAQALADFNEEHACASSKVRFVALPQPESISSAPDALARAAQASILCAADESDVEDLLVIHASLHFPYQDLSASNLVTSMCSGAAGACAGAYSMHGDALRASLKNGHCKEYCII